jgi:acyl-CoA reductase-like NAD-dependent aldehyde dehydrogenase
MKDLITNAKVTLSNWKETPINKRIMILAKLLDLYDQHKDQISQLITKETGKPISQTIAEVDFFNKFNRWTLENAEKILRPETLNRENGIEHIQVYEPIGVTAIILPWNSPYGIFSWKIFQNLVVGNTVVVKHSELAINLGKFLEKLTLEADLPGNILQFVHGDGSVGSQLIEQDIDSVSFTGSSKTGKIIKALIGDRFIYSTFELGGSNAGIVLQDADVDQIVDRIVYGRFSNNGQNCDAIKRLFVHNDIYDILIDRLISKISTLQIGDPFDKDVFFGPLVSKKQFENAQRQLNDALEKGAHIYYQKSIPKNITGNYFEPTIVTDISGDMRIMREEVFAPILPVIKFNTHSEAIELANSSDYGLGATIFTDDVNIFCEIASDLNVTNVEQNGISQWEAYIPFGGRKNSGNGLENGKLGLINNTRIKILSKQYSK